MGDQWYCNRGSQRFGPFSPLQLKQLARDGKLRPTDLLWKEGMPQPVPAGQAGGLFPNAAAEKKEASDGTSSTPRPAAMSTRTKPAASGSVTGAPRELPHAEIDQVEFIYCNSLRKLILATLVLVCASAFCAYLALYCGLSLFGVVALPDAIGKPILWAVALILLLAPFQGIYFFILDQSNPRKIVLGSDGLIVPQTNILNRARSIPYASISEVKRLEFRGTTAKVLSIKHAEGKVELASGLLRAPADLDRIQVMLEQRLQR